MGPSGGTLAIASGLGFSDFEFDLPALQGLFIKALRDVSISSEKFSGRQAQPESLNVMAIQWETPKLMYDADTPPKVQRALEHAFAAVDLNLTIHIFAFPPNHEPRFSRNWPDQLRQQ